MKKEYHAFPFLRKIYFVRTAGSEEELRAAHLIQEEIASLGGTSHLEDFEIDACEIKKARVIFDDKYEVEASGSGYSGYTDDDGVEGEIDYVNMDQAFEVRSLKDKIVVTTMKRVTVKLYEKAFKDGAKAIICSTGSVYRDKKDVDLDPYINRQMNYEIGSIPTLMIRSKDLEHYLAKGIKKARVVLQGVDKKATSHNVIADIEGKTFKDEIIVFTAHYDSVSFSKGAYDNGTGVISLLQIYDYYKKHQPERSMRFIFCGSEEMGLLGSKAYTNAHEEEVKEKVVLNINIDMVAATLGRDIACVTGSVDITTYLAFMYKEEGFPLYVYQGVYSSDSTPFADKGVPAISFARLSNPDGAVIHSHYDVIERLSEPNFLNTMDFIIKFASRMANAKKFPIEKFMPSSMVEAIDKYYARKKN